MFLWRWVTNFMDYFRGKSGKLLLIGLDNAGKSTLLHLLKFGKIAQLPPTGKPTSETIKIEQVTFTTYDMGGHLQVRKLWAEYYMNVDAIIFIIDAADEARFMEAKDELDHVLNDEAAAHVPVAILANKIDKPGAKGEKELRNIFNLHGFTVQNGRISKDEFNRPIELFMCSFLYDQGYGNALRWLIQFI